MEWIGILLTALPVVAIAYQAFAWVTLGRFFHSVTSPASSRAVTILKPLHGEEPRLRENLATFLFQNHDGPVQLLCGIASSTDPAQAAVAALREDHPKADITLVQDARRHGANAKVSNLVNMMAQARYDILVLSDSDMSVGPDYLATLIATLAMPGVGAATCFYRGRGDAGFWSRVSAGLVSHVALPDMVIGHVTGLARPCMGSTIALTRKTLDSIGGFERLSDVLADDHAIGTAVADQGLTVAAPPLLLTHACTERTFFALWRQKLRWAITIRGLHPWGYAGSVITRPLPLALLALPFMPWTGIVLTIAALAARLAVAARIDRIGGARSAPLWLLPLIDSLDFLVFAASFTVRKVDWRGNALTIHADGRISA